MCKACALRVYAGLDGITLSSFLPGCFRTCWFDPQMAKREAFWWRKLKSNERCNLPKMVEKDPWKRPKQCNTMPLLQYTCSRNPAQMRCARRDGLHPGLIPSLRFTHVDLQHSTNPYWNSRFCSTILDIWMFFEDFLGGLEQSWLLTLYNWVWFDYSTAQTILKNLSSGHKVLLSKIRQGSCVGVSVCQLFCLVCAVSCIFWTPNLWIALTVSAD